MENSNNTKLIVAFVVMLLLCLTYTSQAQEKEKDKEKRKSKRGWVRISPVPPVPPVQPIQPIAPIPLIQPIAPISPIAPINPIAPITPITPITPISPISPITPITPIAPITPGEGDSHYYSNGNYTVQVWKSDGILVEVRGKIRLERDGSGIRSLARNGHVSIKETDSGREVYVEEEDGELYYTYYKKGKRFEFEGEGQAWFNKVWPDIADKFKPE